MSRQYDDLTTWRAPKPWDSPTKMEQIRTDIEGLLPDPRAGSPAVGKIFVGVLFYGFGASVGFLSLAGLGLVSRTAIGNLLALLALLVWPAVGWFIVRQWRGERSVEVLVFEAGPDRVEIMRFIETRHDGLIQPRDLEHFLKRAEVTGKSGRISWRGEMLPSGVRVNDQVHGVIIDALCEAQVWERGKKRGAGKRTIPLTEAVERVGLLT